MFSGSISCCSLKWFPSCLSEECERRLRYPDGRVQSTIRRFIESVDLHLHLHTRVADKTEAPVRIVYVALQGPEICKRVVHKQLADLSRKINADVSPVYTSSKINDEIKVRDDKLPLESQQCVGFLFQYGLCDVGYVDYTCRHPHQRIEEHNVED